MKALTSMGRYQIYKKKSIEILTGVRFRHKKREAGAGCSHSPMVGYRGLHSDRGWTEGPMESEKRKGAIRKKLRERKSSLFSAALGSSLLKEEGEFGKHRRVIISFRAL